MDNYMLHCKSGLNKKLRVLTVEKYEKYTNYTKMLFTMKCSMNSLNIITFNPFYCVKQLKKRICNIF